MGLQKKHLVITLIIPANHHTLKGVTRISTNCHGMEALPHAWLGEHRHTLLV